MRSSNWTRCHEESQSIESYAFLDLHLLVQPNARDGDGFPGNEGDCAASFRDDACDCASAPAILDRRDADDVRRDYDDVRVPSLRARAHARVFPSDVTRRR